MRVSLIEYKNHVNEEGVPVGHGKKVLTQMSDLLKDMGYTVDICAHASYIADIKEYGTHSLKHNNQCAEYSKLKKLPGIFRNIHDAVRKADADIVWFTNIDIFLLLYLGFFSVRKKIIVTAYEDPMNRINTLGASSRIKSLLALKMRKIALRGLSRINLFVNTYQDNSADSTRDNSLYIPDYIYNEKYQNYATHEKINRVACIGIIDSHKDIEGLIKCFAGLSIPLLIKGYFTDSSQFGRVSSNLPKNIIIENTYLSESEYLQLVSESEYVIAPYFVDEYKSLRTSGVVRDAVYLGAIVIAPKTILEEMKFQGVGYSTLDEVRDFLQSGRELQIENDLTGCSEAAIQRKLQAGFDKYIFNDKYCN